LLEVSVGVQFAPLLGIRPIELGDLRAKWRADLPVAEEHPPLPPSIERVEQSMLPLQLMVGPALHSRVWFMSADSSRLVQVQFDRLSVNWRKVKAGSPYQRYEPLRDELLARAEDLRCFVEERTLGSLSVTQAELSYVNAIGSDVVPLGQLDRVLRHWSRPNISVGSPASVRLSLAFEVEGIGHPPVRLYVEAGPAKGPASEDLLALTLTIRGAPSGTEFADAVSFLDKAHPYIVRTFSELITDEMKKKWGMVP
jgi:uncharacterized protein (TIGR04255 family)